MPWPCHCGGINGSRIQGSCKSFAVVELVKGCALENPGAAKDGFDSATLCLDASFLPFPSIDVDATGIKSIRNISNKHPTHQTPSQSLLPQETTWNTIIR